MFTANDDRKLTANFEYLTYSVNVNVNNRDYGFATGTGVHKSCAPVKVEAFVNNCYRFLNWTIDDVVVSTDNPYSFTANQNVDIVANFYALDFDTYAPVMLKDNTFMLNLKKLNDDGYEVTGCKWFKNGIEETDTRTINEFSYSAGIEITDKLDQDHVYNFQIFTKNDGALCSSKKIFKPRRYLTSSTEEGIFGNTGSELRIYPNPLPHGSLLTIEGVTAGSSIVMYNSSGAIVKSVVAKDSTVTLSITVPAGVYIIRVGERAVKIVVTEQSIP